MVAGFRGRPQAEPETSVAVPRSAGTTHPVSTGAAQGMRIGVTQ